MLDVRYSDRITYILVSQRYATYKEIRDDYDVFEILNLYEIALVSIYNKYQALQRK